MKKYMVFTAAFLLLAGVVTHAQSLGDLANEEQKRRKEIPADKIIVLENVLNPPREETSIAEDEDVPEQAASQQPSQSGINGIVFDIGDNPILGSSTARLILVAFIDYQCPFCGRYALETFPQLKKQYIDTGTIRYVVMDDPLPTHPKAPKAAEASHCADEQGKFWEMHTAMLIRQDALNDLSFYARALKLDVGQFEDCLNKGRYGYAVRKDMELADKLGMNGVPRFIIGMADARNPRIVTGISTIDGAKPLGYFQQELNKALKNSR